MHITKIKPQVVASILMAATVITFTLILISCGSSKRKDTGTNDSLQAAPVSSEKTRIQALLDTDDIVSPLSDNISYLDFDSSSWQREFPPRYIMLHFTSAVVNDKNNPYDIEAVRKIFANSEIGINYLIGREGKINCWLPEERAAWHAGKGSLSGVPEYENNLNRYSIGIEMLAIGTKDEMSRYLTSSEYDSIPKSLKGYTEAQYDALAELIPDICERWDIPCDREHIIGHDEYSDRKGDPGALFDWEKLMTKINKEK